MNALQEAVDCMARCEELRNRDNSHAQLMADKARDVGAVYAAIAQAQALDRIADVLETLSSRLPRLREYVGPVSEDEDADSTD